MALHAIFSFFLLSASFGLGSNPAFAQVEYDAMTIPESYAKDYIFALYSHNEPVNPSQTELASHLNSLGVAYQHRLGHPWLVSVGYRPQFFINRKANRPMSLMTFFNSTQRMVRIYHPLYFLVGTELLYLIPVQKMNPPTTKDPDFNTEIGVGGKASLWYLMGQNIVVSLDLQRWRGTKTDRLHGISVQFGLGWGF